MSRGSRENVKICSQYRRLREWSIARPNRRARIETRLLSGDSAAFRPIARPNRRARIETSSKTIRFGKRRSIARPNRRARIETS